MIKGLWLSVALLAPVRVAAGAMPQISLNAAKWDFSTVVSGTILTHRFSLS